MSRKIPAWVGRAKERRRHKENRDHVRWHEEQRDFWSERLNFLIDYLNRRLQAQDAGTKKKQRWDSVTAVSACFAAIFSLASLGAFLFVSFKAEETARTSAKIAGYQLAEMKAEHRPWIALRGEVVPDSLRFNTAGPSISLKISLRNTGDQPGFGMYPTTILYPPGFTIEGHPITDAPDVYRNACPVVSPEKGHGFDLFPGEQIPGSGGAELPEFLAIIPFGGDIPDPWPSEPTINPGGLKIPPHSFVAYVAACVRYISSSKEIHTTMVVYKVTQPWPQGGWYVEPAASYAD